MEIQNLLINEFIFALIDSINFLLTLRSNRGQNNRATTQRYAYRDSLRVRVGWKIYALVCSVARERPLDFFFPQWATKPQSTVCTRVIGPVWRSSSVVLPAAHSTRPRHSDIGQWRAPQNARRLHSICIRQIKGAVNAASAAILYNEARGARTRKSVNWYSSNNNDTARSRRRRNLPSIPSCFSYILL